MADGRRSHAPELLLAFITERLDAREVEIRRNSHVVELAGLLRHAPLQLDVAVVLPCQFQLLAGFTVRRLVQRLAEWGRHALGVDQIEGGPFHELEKRDLRVHGSLAIEFQQFGVRR